ncbi:MAG: hypothetical protein JO253_05685, partial [Alphaproteobacteria bacterium]|nr:hypothetical protein [Alphaproteobacteria bacterium]
IEDNFQHILDKVRLSKVQNMLYARAAENGLTLVRKGHITGGAPVEETPPLENGAVELF